jgi:hypothetical protein
MRTSKRRYTQGTPLTQLRKQLGSEGRLLSVNKLGVLSGIPSATLRSVEVNRRSFNLDLQKRLRCRGLDWDQKTKQWRFTYDHSAPLTLPLLESFRRLSRGSDLFQDLDAHALCLKVIGLLHEVPIAAYSSLLLDLHDNLERLREAYHIDGAQQVFQGTTLRYDVRETASGSQILIRGYSGANPPKPEALLDFIGLRKSSVRLDKDEHGESPVVQPAA